MIKDYLKTTDYDSVTYDNICDYCVFNPIDCGEMKVCCYAALGRLEEVVRKPIETKPLPFFDFIIIDEEEEI